MPGKTHDLALHLQNESGTHETEFINYYGLIGGPVNRSVNESGSVPLLIFDSNSVSVLGSHPHILK